MNELLSAMSTDMGIRRFHNETEDSFAYRLCYSALGQWCLRTAQNSMSGIIGTTKNNQTIVLNDLIERFSILFPFTIEMFIDSSNQHVNLPVHIRRVYEETGYLLTDENNRNRLANYGRSIQIGNTALFFGLQNTAISVNGLGVFASPTGFKVSTKDFMIRDDLNFEDYFQSRFDPVDFYDRDVEIPELEFFNPKSYKVPSKSWGKQLITDCTIARKTEFGPYYRVMRLSDKIQFADESLEQQNDSFTSYEYRRLYFALKAHYSQPLKATIDVYDELYSKISIGAHLPNREYYYLLLMSWPINGAFDRVNFILRNELLQEVTSVLKNIGIDIKGGHTYE